jgi:hypothetical protein
MPADTEEKNGDGKLARDYEKMRMMVSWLIIAVLIAFGIYLMYKLAHVHETEGEFWKNLIQKQFPVVVGLPMAGLGSLFLTLVLRISTGPIEFEVGGVKFKGGAAPIVFWLLCFLSISGSIALLWQ